MIAVGPENEIIIPIEAAAAIPSSARDVDKKPETNKNDCMRSVL